MTISPIVIFGGSFDPIHKSHIDISLDVLSELKLTEIYLLPCNIAVHKKTQTSSYNRIKMLEIAIRKHKNVKIDNREIMREGKSYMIDTLLDIKKNNPSRKILLVMGSDSLNNFHKWKSWREILELTHLVVAIRKSIPIKPHNELVKYLTNNKEELWKKNVGSIYYLPGKYINVNSTAIRSNLKENKKVDGLDNYVLEYIQSNELYL
ncbi:MAG: nicotinate (nicotinamide) nucleotide adenylyltransferase [Pseudomonadota bacterium]|nr:nicotinate (nicotinamide) nucleotide adenylyltransferase [Pseudomonadota bacterium]